LFLTKPRNHPCAQTETIVESALLCAYISCVIWINNSMEYQLTILCIPHAIMNRALQVSKQMLSSFPICLSRFNHELTQC
jgi:hypothetical protein